jgi:hypothetical protein
VRQFPINGALDGTSPSSQSALTGITGTNGVSANHTHTFDMPAFAGTSGAASTTTTSGASPSLATHNHTISGSTADGGFANTAMNTLPQYLQVFYIMRVK